MLVMDAGLAAAAGLRSGMPFDLVLFDLDGTLVDTAPDIADALNRVLLEAGLQTVAERWVRERIGHGARELLVQALDGRGGVEATHASVADPRLPALLREFSRHFALCCGRRGSAYPGAARTLAMLRRAGMKLACVTNKEARDADLVLRVHGLDERFDLRVGGDTLAVRKPDAGVVEHCLAHFGVAPARALLVGDSEIDLETARNAGIAMWAVPWGYNRGRPVAAARPDRMLRELPELVPLLQATG